MAGDKGVRFDSINKMIETLLIVLLYKLSNCSL